MSERRIPGSILASPRCVTPRAIRIGALVALALHPLNGDAQIVRGRLLDASSRAPINTALVVLLDTTGESKASAVTDDSGRFILAANRSGTYRISAERIGYRTSVSDTVNLLQGPTRYFEFLLDTRAVVLDPLRIVATPRVPSLVQAGFYARKQAGPGVFITRDEFEFRRPRYPSDVLRSAPGVIVQNTGSGNIVSFMRGGSSSFRGCEPQLWLDGMYLPDGGRIDVVSIHDLEAIEAYRGAAQVPAQYSGAHSACGVILLWTRKGPAR